MNYQAIKSQIKDRFVRKFRRESPNKIKYYIKHGSFKSGIPIWIVVILIPDLYYNTISEVLEGYDYLVFTLVVSMFVGFFVGVAIYRFHSDIYNRVK